MWLFVTAYTLGHTTHWHANVSHLLAHCGAVSRMLAVCSVGLLLHFENEPHDDAPFLTHSCAVSTQVIIMCLCRMQVQL